MNYTPKEFEELFTSVLEDSVEQGLISHADDFLDLIDNLEDISNYYVLDKSVIANLIANFVYPDITSVYESAKVIYAEGSDLDDLGSTRGIPRPPATRASVTATFTLTTSWENIEGDITIDEGIIITTDDGVEYETVGELYLANGNTEVTVDCMSKETGSSVKITANTLTTIVDSLDYDFTVTNTVASSGGDDEYTDDEY